MTSRVIVSIRVECSPERAFEVFTGEIGSWWRPHDLFGLTPRAPGRLAFEPGPEGRLTETLADGQVYEIGRTLDWSPPHRLAFAWRPAWVAADQATEVVVSFEPMGAAETRVTVEHVGWDRVPRENAARHGFPLAATLKHAADWWRVELASFKVKL